MAANQSERGHNLLTRLDVQFARSFHGHFRGPGKIVADANGQADLDRVFSILTLSGPDSIVGHTVVLHADPDDFISQPDGDAGPGVG